MSTRRRRFYSEAAFRPTVERLMTEQGVTQALAQEQAFRPGTCLTTSSTATGRSTSNDVIETLAGALDVETGALREYRLRVITERLERMPELIDRLYKRLGFGGESTARSPVRSPRVRGRARRPERAASSCDASRCTLRLPPPADGRRRRALRPRSRQQLGDVGEALGTVPAVALCGGAALYLLGHIVFLFRTMGRLFRRRTVGAIVLLALVPAAVAAIRRSRPLALVGAVWSFVVAYEVLRYRAARIQVRHPELAD